MKYTPATIVRAVIAGVLALAGAASAAAGGPDLAVLDIGQWLGVIGAGLVAGTATFHNPTKDSINGQAVTSIQDVADKAVESQQKLTQAAVDSVQAVRDAVGNLPVLAPSIVADITSVANPQSWQRPLGELAQEVLSHIET